MKTALIIAASPEIDIDYILDIYNSIKPQLVICADGGIVKARRLAIPCDILMGDMDSGGGGYAEETIVYPAEKNYTDTQTCIEKAIERSCTQIIITGASGGRIDHLLCNIHLLEAAAMRNVSAHILDSFNVISVLKNGDFTVPIGFKYFSIIPLDDVLQGVTIKHCKYPLDNATVIRQDSLTVSNEAINNTAFVEIKKGKALLIFSK